MSRTEEKKLLKIVSKKKVSINKLMIGFCHCKYFHVQWLTEVKRLFSIPISSFLFVVKKSNHHFMSVWRVERTQCDGKDDEKYFSTHKYNASAFFYLCWMRKFWNYHLGTSLVFYKWRKHNKKENWRILEGFQQKILTTRQEVSYYFSSLLKKVTYLCCLPLISHFFEFIKFLLV